MGRRARLSKTVIQTDEVGVPPLLAYGGIGYNHPAQVPVGKVRALKFAPAALHLWSASVIAPDHRSRRERTRTGASAG